MVDKHYADSLICRGMKEVDALDALKAFVKKFQTQRAAATALGMSDVYLSDILHGRRGLSDVTLAKLGLKRSVVKA